MRYQFCPGWLFSGVAYARGPGRLGLVILLPEASPDALDCTGSSAPARVPEQAFSNSRSCLAVLLAGNRTIIASSTI